MDPQAALNMLNENVANLNGTREAHVLLARAVAILQASIDAAAISALSNGHAEVGDLEPVD